MDDESIQRLLIGAGIMYVSIHPRSEQEIVTYITKRNGKLHGSDAVVSQTLARLKELGYIDDKKYSRMFIESRNRSRPKGKTLIHLELRKKGVSREVIDLVDAQMDQIDSPSDTELARTVAQKKYSILKKMPIQEQRKRLFGFLQRRGFASTVIFRIIDELTGNRYNGDNERGQIE